MREKLKFKEIENRRNMIQDDILRSTEDYKLCWAQIELLLDMAVNGDIPTGNFSDLECSVWSNMRRLLTNNDVEIRDI